MKNIKLLQTLFLIFNFIKYLKAIELNRQYLENLYGVENLNWITYMGLDNKGFTSVNSNIYLFVIKL